MIGKKRKFEEPKPPGSFNALVKEALQVEREISKADPGNFKWSKMDASEFLDAALKNCGKTRKEIEALYNEIRRRKDLPNLAGFVANLTESFSKPVGGATEPPVENFKAFAPDRRAENPLVGVLIELQLLPNHPSALDAIAAAALAAVKEFPQNFGFPEAEKQRLRQLGDKRDELLKRIPEEFTPDDLTFTEVPGGAGLAKVCFRCSGGAVSVLPKGDAGGRLVRHLLERPELIKTYLG